jgi:hypothetical protein
VLGGVLLAIEMLDLPLTSSIVDRLVSSSQRCEVTCVA